MAAQPTNIAFYISHYVTSVIESLCERRINIWEKASHSEQDLMVNICLCTHILQSCPVLCFETRWWNYLWFILNSMQGPSNVTYLVYQVYFCSAEWQCFSILKTLPFNAEQKSVQSLQWPRLKFSVVCFFYDSLLIESEWTGGYYKSVLALKLCGRKALEENDWNICLIHVLTYSCS